MHWTPEEIIKVLQAMTPLLTAIGTVISAVSVGINTANAWQIKRARANIKENTEAVVQVHACLAEARGETLAGIQEVKAQAQEVAQAVASREK